MTATQIIRAVSADLNDQEPGYEFEHWSSPMLKHYLLEALIQLSQIFPELFIKRFTVKVEPGGVWQRACCECDQILRIVGETNKEGTEIIRTLARVADNPRNEWPTGVGDICPRDPDTYKMVGASISNSDGRYFRVMPPVPAEGVPHYISLECYAHVHGIEGTDEVHWRLIPAVKMWMLARAYMVDGENSPAMAQLAERYMNLYDSTVKILRGALEAEEEEKNFGRSVRTVSNNADK